MKFKDFLRAPKVVTDHGKWVTGKPNRKLLDLSRGQLALGGQWTWRKMVLEVEQRAFHVVIAVHEGKENYVAHLATPLGNDNLVLASIEHHGTHPGWHLHVNCNAESGTNVGRLRYPAQRRIPDGKRLHRVRPWPVTQAAGLEPVIQFFRIPVSGDSRSLQLW